LDIGPSEQQTLKIAQAIGFPEKLVPEVQRQINNIYKMFVSKDCLLVELNPFIETDDGRGNSLSIALKIEYDVLTLILSGVFGC
jgi:succinyl-CoA synthetase beta subunit